MTDIKHIPQPSSWEYEHILMEARKLMGSRASEFDEFGSSLKILDSKKPTPYLTSNDVLAQYADIITCAFPDACIAQLVSEPGNFYLFHHGTCFIWGPCFSAWANMAYCTINCITKDLRNFALNWMTYMKKSATEAYKDGKNKLGKN